MDFTLLDNVLWAASLIGNAALLFVLIYRKRWREFPVFSGWIAFDVTLEVLMLVVYRHGSAHLYSAIYWISVAVDFALQLGVVFEIARIVLRPTGTWLRDARTRFLTIGSLGALLAAGVAFAVQPSAPTSLDAWEVRGNLFTSIIICELFLAMQMSSNRMGLQWRSHVMGLGQGLAAWGVVAFCVDALHGLLGSKRDFSALEHARIFVWIGAVVYWLVIFWLPQPERLPLSPEMNQYLVDLHARVRYDLDKVESRRPRV